jgi:GMP synthase-like glutamine amidotransferase
MSSAVILQHAPFEGPGRIVSVFRDFGIPCDVRHLYKGDEVPTDLDEIRILVVLDGPIRVADVGSEKFPFLAAEVETLKRLVAVDRPVLAINFGAQLLAHAAGAKVYPNAKPGAKPEDPTTPMPEFGWNPVQFPFPGGTDPLVFGLSEGAPMFHWHVDTFDLPRLPAPANPAPPPSPPPPTGNVLLSTTRACKNQAFRFKSRLVGFQYHFELTEAGIEAMLANRQQEITAALGSDAAQNIREQTPKNYPRYARLGNRILENFVQYLKAYNP